MDIKELYAEGLTAYHDHDQYDIPSWLNLFNFDNTGMWVYGDSSDILNMAFRDKYKKQDLLLFSDSLYEYWNLCIVPVNKAGVNEFITFLENNGLNLAAFSDMLELEIKSGILTTTMKGESAISGIFCFSFLPPNCTDKVKYDVKGNLVFGRKEIAMLSPFLASEHVILHAKVSFSLYDVKNIMKTTPVKEANKPPLASLSKRFSDTEKGLYSNMSKIKKQLSRSSR